VSVKPAEVLFLRRVVEAHQHRLFTFTIHHPDSPRLGSGINLIGTEYLNDRDVEIRGSQQIESGLIDRGREQKVGDPNRLTGTAHNL
jgi:hypothetical protein